MNSIGLKKVTFYLIRHKASNQIMPQCRRNRGYSHWNPNSNDIISSRLFLNVPRLLESEKQAKRCIAMWFAFPNGRNSVYQSYTGEWDDTLDFKPDNRKKDDLEILKVRISKN